MFVSFRMKNLRVQETFYDTVNSSKKKISGNNNHKNSRFWSHNQTKPNSYTSIKLSKDINKILSSTDHSQSYATQETAQDSKLKHHIDALNNKRQHSAYSKHHDIHIAE